MKSFLSKLLPLYFWCQKPEYGMDMYIYTNINYLKYIFEMYHCCQMQKESK